MEVSVCLESYIEKLKTKELKEYYTRACLKIKYYTKHMF